MGVFSNPVIFVGIAAITLLQLGFVYLPFMQQLFNSAPLGVEAWLRALLVGACVWPVVGLEKYIRRRQESQSEPVTSVEARVESKSGGL
ncbi:MAG: cation transporting ATPase C-terminal domain-containing protein [Deltaproteobacteria bacterium]|nr:cation transporting ATPase C-terminal domain-containing protein [Deltaproteobacteria bacterium]